MAGKPRTRMQYFDDPVQLGRRLRELGFAGCTGAYISRIERGQRVPSLQLLRELAQRLEVDEEWLARGRRPDIEAHISKKSPDDLGQVAISVTAYTDGRAKTVDLETVIYEGTDEALEWVEDAVISSFSFGSNWTQRTTTGPS